MRGRIAEHRAAFRAVIAVTAVMVGSLVVPTWSHYIATTTNAPNSFLAASSFYRAEVLADSPVSYWRLGELSGTTAIDEQARNNGTYAGGYTLGIADALANDVNTAVDFDGASGRVSIPDSPTLDFSTQISIEAWVRPDTVTGHRRIVSKGDNYRLYFFDGNTSFGVLTPLGTSLSVTTSSVTTGAWQHLVGTFDGATVTLYRNGVNVGEADLGARSTPAGRPRSPSVPSTTPARSSMAGLTRSPSTIRR